MLAAARHQAGAVDVVVLPESAVEDTEIDDLETLLARHGVTGLITGIRGRPAQPGQFPRNGVHIGVSTGGQWTHIRQAKHHRWSLQASWEQAAAEALAFAPERLRAVTADAQAGAPWRAELGIRQPSTPLQHSISGIFRMAWSQESWQVRPSWQPTSR